MMATPRRGREALDTLRNIPLFSSVRDSDLESIAALLIERRFPRHKTIVEEGLPGDYMYVICEGRVQVSKLTAQASLPLWQAPQALPAMIRSMLTALAPAFISNRAGWQA